LRVLHMASMTTSVLTPSLRAASTARGPRCRSSETSLMESKQRVENDCHLGLAVLIPTLRAASIILSSYVTMWERSDPRFWAVARCRASSDRRCGGNIVPAALRSRSFSRTKSNRSSAARPRARPSAPSSNSARSTSVRASALDINGLRLLR